MAPEIKILYENRDVDETVMVDGCKADIYSLGISMLSLIIPN